MQPPTPPPYGPPFEPPPGFAPPAFGQPPAGQYPWSPAPPPPLPPSGGAAPLGLAGRLAGVALLLNAALLLVEMAVMPHQAATTGPALRQTPVPAVIDAVIGITLLAGRASLVPWAMVRVVLGGVVFTGLYAARRDFLLAGLQLALSAALMLLLAGRAGRVRTAVGATLFVLVVGLECAGLVAVRTGYNPVAGLSAALSREYTAPPGGVVRGREYPYQLVVPSGWLLRTTEATRRENAAADRWVSRPERDAHVVVVGNALQPEQFLEPDRGVDLALTELREHFGAVTIVRREPFPGRPDARLVEAELTAEGTPATALIEVLQDGAAAYQLTATAPRVSAAAVREELLAILRSFRADPLIALPERPPAADGAPRLAEPAGRTMVTRDGRYEVQLPPGWYVRNDAEARADNPDVDRWALLPYRGMNLTVITEALPADAEVTVDALADAVVQMHRERERDVREIDRGPLPGAPAARLLRFAATQGDQHLLYVTAVFVDGTHANQVIAWGPPELTAASDATLVAALQTFRAHAAPAAGNARRR